MIVKSRVEGIIEEALPNANFKVKINSGEFVLAYLSGRMRMNYIRLAVGDRVALELSPDGKRGRIVLRK